MGYRHLCIVAGFIFSTTLWAAGGPPALKEDKQHVNSWNRFSDALLKLHHWYQGKHEIKEVSTTAGYAGQPDFYTEVQYFDKQSQRLLSTVQWERGVKDRVHMIAVYIYDNQGRVVRDYLAAWLPQGRNAPVQTLINFHYYNDELHSYRQFDASGNHIYEQCQGRYFNEQVMVSTDEDDFDTAYGDGPGQTGMETYLACFEMLPKEAGRYRHPDLAEINMTGEAIQPAEVSLITHEEMDKLINQITAQINTSPNDADLFVQRGDAWFKLHEFDKAVRDYTQALGIDRQHSRAWFGRGMAYGRMGEIDKGIADLGEFIKREPNSSTGYTKRGVRYLWKGDRDHAEQDFLMAIKIDPNNAEANDDLGVIYAQRGELDKALQHFNQTVRVDPTYQKGFHNLAMTYFLAAKYTQALQAVNQALALRAEVRETLLLKSRILTALGQKEQALAIKNEAEFLPEGNWSELAPSH
ncbi:MAG: tetratricopeptide repeat protein [Gammaproteobacteria bacterium]|nr:tetratricopeptide repeat protein [Gammaproteobacteria bacterium]MDH5651031.1 tetratricopeptide repeat protein [Gammaproteobacteria bacterium]